MREYLKKLPEELLGLIYRAGDIAAKNNMPVYLVGGFVRDLILGIKNLDLDIAVEGDGIKFAEKLSESLKAKIRRHKRFGTATIILGQNSKIDITTARAEYYPQPTCLPIVSSGSIKDDLKRRDFTINAMAISITAGDFGRLIDFFDGEKDLRNKKIRILHKLSFIDDPTRILRAIRFEKRYNFRIESDTLKCLKETVRLKMLERVEPQRIRDDLILILKENHPLRQIRRIKELVGFGFIDRHLSVSRKTYSLLASIEKEITWFKKAYPQRRHLDLWLIYFMGLVGSLRLNYLEKTCRRFALGRGEMKRIITYKRINYKSILSLARKKVEPPKIFAFFEPLSYEVILLLKAKYKNRYIYKHIEEFFEIYNGMRIYISGDDLHSLGLAPGPAYQKIFAKVLNAKLNGQVKTKEEELSLIKKLIKK